MSDDSRTVSRRQFLNRAAAGAAGLALAPALKPAHGSASANPQASSRVVTVRDDAALDGSAIRQEAVQVMMDEGIRRLTGIPDVGEAWKSLFPGITPASIIAVKVNCLFRRMSTHPPVTETVLDGLKRMVVDGAPFPENNIVVWDWQTGQLTAAGYVINKGTTGVRCISTSTYYGTQPYTVDGSPAQRLSKILTDDCQYLVNVSVLKNHFASGVSLSMKNHYGSVNNPGALQHDNGCIASIPSINALEPIRNKQVVVICDAIFGVISNGPDASPQVSPKSLLLSRDPVAMDTIGAKMLEAHGCRTASITGAARHITTASLPPYSLGICDLSQIESIVVENPFTNTGIRESGPSRPGSFVLSQNYPNPFNAETMLEYRIEKSGWIRFHVVNALGEPVQMLEDGPKSAGQHRTAWDGRAATGIAVPSGVYLAVLEFEGERRTVRMNLVR